ncbi:2'-5' RNA ligase family protein [Pseudomonas sp. HK3]
MRLFLGVSSADLGDQVLDDMCDKYTVTRPHLAQDRHMTLCFLGEYSYEQQQQLILALDNKIEKESFCSIHWRGDNIRSFPRDAPTAWAWQGALTSSLECFMVQLCELPMLQAQLCLASFVPHVTLAYMDTARQNYPDIKLERDMHFTQLILYCSIAESEPTTVTTHASWAKPRYRKLKIWKI